MRRDDFCARIKITSYVLALQIFLFLRQGWIGLPNTISPNNHVILAHNGHGDGDGDGPYEDGGDCDGDGPWWVT